MFGIVRPCRHRLGEKLTAQWTAHLCGLCLALRGDHGQLARIVTKCDDDPLDDLLPGNWVDTKAAETTFETSNIANAA